MLSYLKFKNPAPTFKSAQGVKTNLRFRLLRPGRLAGRGLRLLQSRRDRQNNSCQSWCLNLGENWLLNFGSFLLGLEFGLFLKVGQVFNWAEVLGNEETIVFRCVEFLKRQK